MLKFIANKPAEYTGFQLTDDRKQNEANFVKLLPVDTFKLEVHACEEHGLLYTVLSLQGQPFALTYKAGDVAIWDDAEGIGGFSGEYMQEHFHWEEIPA